MKQSIFRTIVLSLLLLQLVFVSKAASISVCFSEDKYSHGTLVLQVWPEIFSSGQLADTPHLEYEASSRKGKYRFQLPDSLKFGWFSLAVKAKGTNPEIPILQLFIVDQDDDVTILLTERPPAIRRWGTYFDAIFKGKSAHKYACMWKIRQATHHLKIEKLAVRAMARESSEIVMVEKRIDVIDSIFQSLSLWLDSNEKHLPTEAFALLNLELFSWQQYMVYDATAVPILTRRNTANAIPFRASYADSLANLFLKNARDPRHLPYDEELAVRSGSYLDMAVDYERYRTRLLRQPLKWHQAFNYLDKTSILRQRLLVNALRRVSPKLVSYKLIEDLTKAYEIRDKFSVDMLKDLRKGLPGAPAYNFSLRDASGKIVRLSDYRGKVVFLDFWFGACGPCQNFYKGVVSPVHDQYRTDPRIVFISICVDQKKVWRSMLDKGLFTSPDAVNVCTDGIEDGRRVLTEYNVFGYPKPVLINQDGIIVRLKDTIGTKTELKTAIETLLADVKK